MKDLDTCPVCNNANLKLAYSGQSLRVASEKHKWSVSQCRDCGHGFINPQPEWDDLKHYYDSSYGAYETSHGTTADDAEVIAKARKDGEFRHLSLPIEGKKILDVGTGGGFFLRICKELGAEVQGVEPSEVAAKIVRGQGIEVFHGMLDDFETDERFDIITANQVLEHTSDPVATLAKMRSLLADGGLIWIAVPNADCLWAKILGARWDGADLPYHLMQFTPSSLRKAAESAGLTVGDMQTVSVPWITRHSIRKSMREYLKVPTPVSGVLVPLSLATAIGERMDRRRTGDNMIFELLPA
ncbi:class I SAM-dependent methyltransferase [Qipengyuania vesicularis]|uniref:class I SAM-dependent methyltransferase n=1 Tax=Qipengyuania vesicularis TaxID=2867232 RepID=UPI001C879B56|nr:class I SAM-dependent methyltransferase [Qipengyuania vesicularis]MBX7527523.1 class I SAM-dependent methyltransferase [Qipengyuania vesicularis]